MSAPDLSADFYDAWTAGMRGLGLDPLDIARVAFAETGMFQRHPRNPQIGVWPFIPSTLRSMGWTGTAAEFTAQPPEDQVPWVVRYLAPNARFLTNDGLVYVDTFLPAKVRAASQSDDSFVLTSQGDGTGFYENNKILDRDGDGSITVGDLRTWLVTQDRGARWDTIESELRARGASGSAPGGGGLSIAGRTIPWTGVLLLSGLGLWWLANYTKAGASAWRSVKGATSGTVRSLKRAVA